MRWLVLGVLLTTASALSACQLYEPPTQESTSSDGASSNADGGTKADGGSSNTTGEAKPDGTASAVPTEANALLAYLQKGTYRSWAQESAPHQTQGPHKSGTLVFFNDILEKSFQANNTSHPKGSVTVKELYEADLKTPAGWSVMVKVDDDSQQGRGWYWFEVFTSAQGNRFIADGKGVQLCTGCHQPGKDYVLTKFPLQ